MFFESNKTINCNEINHCKDFAKTLNYNFDDEAIKLMLRMLNERIVTPEVLYKILSKTKKELEKQ